MALWSWVFQKIAAPSVKAPSERAPLCSQGGAAVATDFAEPAIEPLPDLDAWWAPKGPGLLEPVKRKIEDCNQPVQFLENILISHFDGHDLSMPQLNNVVEQILPKLRSDRCDLKTVGHEIAADQVLSAVVLRTANSPMYRGLQNITAVPAAVGRIGTKGLRTILLHQSVRSAIFTKNSMTRQLANILWRRSLRDACIMRGLGGLMGMDEDDCHLIGLMHDIGSVLVLRIINDRIKHGHASIDLQSFEYLRQETHQEFGELVAKAWELPPDLTQLIMNHHAYPNPKDPCAAQRWMLILTEMIGEMIESETAPNYDLVQCHPAVELGLSTRLEYQEWLSRLPGAIEQSLLDLDT